MEIARGGVPRATSVLPYTPLRAKKGLSTPLLVAAAAPHGHAQRALAREDVPEVEVGASGLPLHALPAPVRERAYRCEVFFIFCALSCYKSPVLRIRRRQACMFVVCYSSWLYRVQG
jgi:hypothetical protein